MSQITTLGKLKASGYQPKSIKEELRQNLITKLKKKEDVFPGIYGYEDTVVPDIQRAILSQHNINLLGLRGQAKTRIARLLINLLDEEVPVVAGSELNDDPMRPISKYAIDLIAEKGDDTPISWWKREDRYTEKLATPDVSVADLIGDVDPIKAATLKLPYSDERVIHFGLVPRANRGLFVINELPDLQARIQVALFNILQEGDIQIRGFKIRMPIDVQFIFTANPEDYTNRGSIVTPLKDRIGSQIITHYPDSLDISKRITAQEAKLSEWQKSNIIVPEMLKDLIEQIAIEARDNEYVDAKSGVSARLTISAFESMMSAAERRALINGEEKTQLRIGDLYGAIPAITGKVELVYEGEQEGAGIVAYSLIGKAIRTQFLNYFPDPESFRKEKEKNPYNAIIEWFGEGNAVDLNHDTDQSSYNTSLKRVSGLDELMKNYHATLTKEQQLLMKEFALHGLSEYSMISKKTINAGLQFKDLLSSMFDPSSFGEEDEDYE
ncbi:MAG: sigma 54-interacting transcriptional regulator [Cyclobacteriaceae bacterium]|nr:sigma 54-interacting transcriptional regulator [Cyclobacteriaceae bacterium]MCH8517529.1 sigma 54-interacting transcriptional regulator [Cyclobacteriaceae bacterium]